jgi:hypothetical protein
MLTGVLGVRFWLNIIDVHSEKDALAFLDERKALSR